MTSHQLSCCLQKVQHRLPPHISRSSPPGEQVFPDLWSFVQFWGCCPRLRPPDGDPAELLGGQCMNRGSCCAPHIAVQHPCVLALSHELGHGHPLQHRFLGCSRKEVQQIPREAGGGTGVSWRCWGGLSSIGTICCCLFSSPLTHPLARALPSSWPVFPAMLLLHRCLLSQQLFCSTSYFDCLVNYLSRWSESVVVRLACFFHTQILRRSGQDEAQRALQVVPSAGCACFGCRSASPGPNPCPRPFVHQIQGVYPPWPCSFPCTVRPHPSPAAIRNWRAFIFLALNFNQMQIPSALQTQRSV